MTPLHGFGAAAAPPGEERRGAADVEQGAPPQAGPSQREAAQTLPVRGQWSCGTGAGVAPQRQNCTFMRLWLA